MFHVYSQSLGDFATNAHILVIHNEAIAIDAPPGALSFYKRFIEKNDLQWRYLLLTHSHFDHIADAKAIQDMGIKVGIHPKDVNNCIHPGSDGLPLMMNVLSFKPDFFLDEGTNYLDNHTMLCLHTPGHTPGGVCLIKDDIMFSGDTFFEGAIGNLSFPTCNMKDMCESLSKLVALETNYRVYPGHGPSTSLEREKPFLKTMIYQIGQLCH